MTSIGLFHNNWGYCGGVPDSVKNWWEFLTGDDGVGFGVFISLTLLLANLQMGSVNYGRQGLNFTC